MSHMCRVIREPGTCLKAPHYPGKCKGYIYLPLKLRKLSSVRIAMGIKYQIGFILSGCFFFFTQQVPSVAECSSTLSSSICTSSLFFHVTRSSVSMVNSFESTFSGLSIAEWTSHVGHLIPIQQC